MCKIAFVKGSKVAADDDQQHLRSALSLLFGLVRRRNPKKGYGPVIHGFVSVFTRMFLGGHICQAGETTLHAFITVFKEWCREDNDTTESPSVNLEDTWIFSDREYQSENFLVCLSQVNARTVGTHISRGKYPFASSSSSKKRKETEGVEVIEETGAAYCKWKKRSIINSDKAKDSCYAVAHRSGMGKVTFLHTTAPNCGPGNWSLCAENRGKRVTSKPTVADGTSLDHAIKNNIKILTYSQGSEDWHTSRRFKMTGTVAYAGIREYIKRTELDDAGNKHIPILMEADTFQNLIEPILEKLQVQGKELVETKEKTYMRNKKYSENELNSFSIAILRRKKLLLHLFDKHIHLIYIIANLINQLINYKKFWRRRDLVRKGIAKNRN